MILGYKNIGGDEWWYGKINATDVKFCRVSAGLMIPRLDRQEGALVAVGEHYSRTSPPRWLALMAAVGGWPQLERSCAEFRKSLKIGTLVIEPSPDAREAAFRIPGLDWSLEVIPLVTVDAEAYFADEIARQKVNQLLPEKRLDLSMVQSILEQSPEQGFRALQAVMTYHLDNVAFYPKTVKPMEFEHTWGELR